jgi:SOS-response transcriptional repressor LexA
LNQRLTDDSGNAEDPSLLATLSVGKEAAAAISPLKALRNDLLWAHSKRKELEEREVANLLLNEIKAPLEALKALKKYADSEVQTVFAQVKNKTISNWNVLYPASSGGLSPARVIVGAGRDKSVTTFLAGDGYEVQGQFFGNAGLQRAVALSFYFALLEQHPRGLGFAIMDDPILSLDDGHRESWSLEILKPWMERAQFIVATHQSHYLTNCRSHFNSEQVVELNPRNRRCRISWRPGNRLDRAEEEIERAPTNAPTEMRKYREDLLYSLDAYSTTPFFSTGNLTGSLDAYEGFSGSHPLASNSQRKIVEMLKDERVTKVLDPGSHAITEADVTFEMVQACHAFLKRRDGTVRHELERLETSRLHSRRQSAIPSSLVPFVSLPSQATWDASFELNEFGRAAARGDSLEVDVPSDPSVVCVAKGGAIVVNANTLDPVAKRGQWLLLATEDIAINDGDLVAVDCVNGGRFLRRSWVSGNNLSLQSINPIEPVADVIVPRIDSSVRKIIGVLYEPHREMNTCTVEWSPRADFQVDWVQQLSTVHVEGRSLDPIARSGQKVLIDTEPVADYRQIANGTIAVVESNVHGIGCVIKRVYHIENSCVLTSVNPVEPHPPKVVSEGQLATARFWKVRGVLFESIE